jgi:hypothetical protein
MATLKLMKLSWAVAAKRASRITRRSFSVGSARRSLAGRSNPGVTVYPVEGVINENIVLGTKIARTSIRPIMAFAGLVTTAPSITQ